MDVNQMMLDTLGIMGFGVGGVFLVLTVFYGMIRLMLRFFPAGENEN